MKKHVMLWKLQTDNVAVRAYRSVRAVTTNRPLSPMNSNP